MKVDLYLGSDIGKWVLSQVSPDDVACVVSDDEDINAEAARLGFRFAGDRPPVAFSIHYHHIFTPYEIAQYDRIYNLHPSYLPWGRGYYPMFWALYVPEFPGATLHVIDHGIDTGPIVDSRVVALPETGDELFKSVRGAEMELFKMNWPLIKDGIILASRPQRGVGSYHSKADFDRLIAENGHLPEVQRCLLSSMSGSLSSQTAGS